MEEHDGSYAALPVCFGVALGASIHHVYIGLIIGTVIGVITYFYF